MTKDKLTDVLLDALKRAIGTGEQRLFRAGKLDGLFASRSGVNGDAAAQALRDELLEPVRTETKGKATVEWVRLSPRGMEFLHDHESPVIALHELRDFLRQNQEGLPAWLSALRQRLQELDTCVTDEVRQLSQRLGGLQQRVEDTLRRLEDAAPTLPAGVTGAVPWAKDATTYLDHRKIAGANGPCPLPELFTAVQQQHETLTIREFHEGLRLLRQRRALQLAAFRDSTDQLPQPEFALLDGAELLYFAGR
jgi:hypothetical protein